MSGVINRKATIATTATNDMFADSAFLYSARNAVVSLAVTADLTGGLLTVYSGGRLIAEEGPVKIRATSDTNNTDEDFMFNFVQAAGERLTVSVRNTNAGNIVVNAIAQIQDL